MRASLVYNRTFNIRSQSPMNYISLLLLVHVARSIAGEKKLMVELKTNPAVSKLRIQFDDAESHVHVISIDSVSNVPNVASTSTLFKINKKGSKNFKSILAHTVKKCGSANQNSRRIYTLSSTFFQLTITVNQSKLSRIYNFE